MAGPADVRLHLLGPLRVTAGGEAVIIRGTLKHRLIGRLALTPTSPVSLDSLIDAMWGDHAPRTARQSVHVHISHLRDRLREHRADHLISTRVDGRYELGINAELLDVSRFSSGVAAGRAALRSGDARQARDLLADAVELWDEPFHDLADLPAAIVERQRLITLSESAHDALGAAHIALGELDEAVSILGDVVASGPLRERPYALLMRALLDRGEPTRALEVHRTAIAAFQDALGIAVAEELDQLAAVARRPARTVTRKPASPGDDLDLESATLVRVPDRSDVRPLVDAIATTAARQRRRLVHARVDDGGHSTPVSPMFELAGLVGSGRLAGGDRQAFFERLTHAFVARHSAAVVVVLEGIEHASVLLLEYLRSALSRAGPAPFTIVAIDTSGRDDRRWSPDAEALWMRRVSIDLPSIPPLGDQIDQMTDDEKVVLQLLAASPTAVPLDVATLASGVGPGQIADAADRLSARRVALKADGGLALLFPADRSALATPGSAGAVHLSLADAYARSGGGVDTAVAEARHRLAALPDGDARRAWASALTAARALEALGAFGELVDLVDGTTSVDVAATEDPVALEVLVLIGRARIRGGDHLGGRRDLEAAIDAARRLRQPLLFAEAVRHLAEERAPQRSRDEVRALIVEALDGLDESPTDTRIQLMTDLANSAYLADPLEAERLGAAALEAASEAPPATLARAITGYVQTLMRPGTAEQRRQLAIRAQRHARESGSIESHVLSLTYEAMALVELGEPRRATAPLEYAAALAADVQVPRFQWWAASWHALVAFVLGGDTDVEDAFRGAFEIWPDSTRSDPFECLASQVAMVRLLDDRGAELLPVLADLAQPGAAPAYLAPAALAFAQAGEVDRAIEAVDRLLDVVDPRQRLDITTPFVLAMTAEAAHRCGHEVAGPRLSDRIEPIGDAHVVLNIWGGGGFYWGSLRHAAGLAHALAGRPADAADALGAAVAEHDRASAPLFAARSRAALAALA